MDLAESCRRQAQACVELGSPMYADLLGRIATDLEEGGVCATVLEDHAEAAGPAAVGLRLLGSVHRLVLERRAGALATFYPSVGGRWEGEGGWQAFCDLLSREPDAVREWLDRPPQTNEVGRSAGLMAGLLALGVEHGDLPVQLLEIGSSGGLNLLADRFRYGHVDGRWFGYDDSPVALAGAWSGDVPVHAPWPRIVERLGTDLAPLDVATTEHRLALTAYVWPDQAARLERLRGAFALAGRDPLRVARTSAADAVDALELVDGSVTVLWHSVMWQYLTSDEQEHVRRRIGVLGARATRAAPFAHLFLEPTRRAPGEAHEFLVVLESWPVGTRRVIATSRGHGVPTAWESPPLDMP